MPTVVIYHHISERPDPLTVQLGIRTEPELFLSHMQFFARNFDLVSLADLTAAKPPRRALLVTFDDAYRSVLDVAGPILKSFSAPATFFLNPGTVLSRSLPIDNLVSLAVSTHGLQAVLNHLGPGIRKAASAADLLTGTISECSAGEVDAIKARLLSLLGTTADDIRAGSHLFLDPAGVRELPAFGIEVGNHSMTHSFFRSLSRDELNREIVDSRAALEDLSGQSVTSLSIPYGHQADATATALDIARRSGHRAIFLVHNRSNVLRSDRDVYFRTNPHSAPVALLPLVMGVLPFLRTLSSRIK